MLIKACYIVVFTCSKRCNVVYSVINEVRCVMLWCGVLLQ